MAITNCIVTDDNYILSLTTKMVLSPNGTILADLYPLDLEKCPKNN